MDERNPSLGTRGKKKRKRKTKTEKRKTQHNSSCSFPPHHLFLDGFQHIRSATTNALLSIRSTRSGPTPNSRVVGMQARLVPLSVLVFGFLPTQLHDVLLLSECACVREFFLVRAARSEANRNNLSVCFLACYFSTAPTPQVWKQL